MDLGPITFPRLLVGYRWPWIAFGRQLGTRGKTRRKLGKQLGTQKGSKQLGSQTTCKRETKLVTTKDYCILSNSSKAAWPFFGTESDTKLEKQHRNFPRPRAPELVLSGRAAGTFSQEEELRNLDASLSLLAGFGGKRGGRLSDSFRKRGVWTGLSMAQKNRNPQNGLPW